MHLCNKNNDTETILLCPEYRVILSKSAKSLSKSAKSFAVDVWGKTVFGDFLQFCLLKTHLLIII